MKEELLTALQELEEQASQAAIWCPHILLIAAIEKARQTIEDCGFKHSGLPLPSNEDEVKGK